MEGERKVLTIRGWKSANEIGKTLCHEHLFIDASALYVSPPENEKEGAEQPLNSIENLGWLRYFPYSNKRNLLVDNFEVMKNELIYYKKAGGETIVDVTVSGIRMDEAKDYYLKVKELSEETEVNIICGTGFYVDHVHPHFVDSFSVDQLADYMVNEITIGILDTDLKAGVIGEIGCSFPLTPNEIKVLKAAAKAQKRTGAPLIIHPGRNENAPIEIVQLLIEFGADIKQTVISHLDRTLFSDEKWIELAKTGTFLELDLFGIECSFYQQNEKVNMPHDGQRIDRVISLVDLGFVNQILLSHDIHTNHRLVSYGGHGFAHLFSRIIPRLSRLGISENDLKKIVVDNPKRWLSFSSPSSS